MPMHGPTKLVEVARRVPLAGGRGDTVCLLRCGHAVLRYQSDADLRRAACDICSAAKREEARAAKSAKSTPPTQADAAPALMANLAADGAHG